jgi:hypothetical protein
VCGTLGSGVGGYKRVEPEVPLGALEAAWFGLDLLRSILLFAGLERVMIEPAVALVTLALCPLWAWRIETHLRPSPSVAGAGGRQS